MNSPKSSDSPEHSHNETSDPLLSVPGARLSAQGGTKESGASFQSYGSSRASVVRFDDRDHVPDSNDVTSGVDSQTQGVETQISSDSPNFLEVPENQRQSTSKPSSLQVLDHHPSQSPRALNMSKDSQHSHMTQDTQGSRMSMSSFREVSSKSPRESTISAIQDRHTTKDTEHTGDSSDSRSRPSGKSSRKHSHRKSSFRSRSRSIGTRGGRSSATSSRSSMSSSSSEGLSERELALVDQSILPLHLRAGAIRSKDDDFGKDKDMLNNVLMLQDNDVDNLLMVEESRSEKDKRSKLLIFLSRFLGHEDGQFNDLSKLRRESIMMQNWQFVIRIYPCLAWCVVVMFLLFLWMMRYFAIIETDAQRMLVRNLMLQTETKVSASLAPTFTLASSLAMAAKAGLLSNYSYAALANVVTPHLLASPSVQHVRVVGATERAATLRPGSLHDASLQEHERIPLMVVATTPCEDTRENPVLCLGLNQSSFIDAPNDGVSVRWQRPGFLTENGQGQSLHVTSWLFSHRLAAQIDATNATGTFLAMEVAIDLSEVSSAVRDFVPEKGATYIITSDGTVIAGSNFMPKGIAQYDPVAGTVVYPRLWDLGLSWTKPLTTAMVHGNKAADSWSGTDIVVVRPLAVGNPASGSFRAGLADLRIVSTAPRTVGISQDLRNLITVGMVFLSAPGVFVFLVLVLMLANACCMSFLRWLFDRVMSYQ